MSQAFPRHLASFKKAVRHVRAARLAEYRSRLPPWYVLAADGEGWVSHAMSVALILLFAQVLSFIGVALLVFIADLRTRNGFADGFVCSVVALFAAAVVHFVFFRVAERGKRRFAAAHAEAGGTCLLAPEERRAAWARADDRRAIEREAFSLLLREAGRAAIGAPPVSYRAPAAGPTYVRAAVAGTVAEDSDADERRDAFDALAAKLASR